MKKFVCALALLFAGTANAGVISIGSGSTSTNDCTIGCMAIYQQAYDSSYFGSSPVTLDSLSLYGGAGYSGTYDVFIGYMNGDYSTITTNFSSNFASGSTLVDSINLATDIVGNVLTIDLGFVYDSNLGDLLIEFNRTSASSSGSFAASSVYNWSRAYEWSPEWGVDRRFAHSGYALNSSFITSSEAVPTPATLALFGLGLAGLGFSRKKKAA